MIPKRLQSLFDAKGYVTLREFSNATGVTYGHALRRVQSGDIPAVDVSAAGSRSQWRLYEEPIREWFAQRQNTKPDIEAMVAKDPSITRYCWLLDKCHLCIDVDVHRADANGFLQPAVEQRSFISPVAMFPMLPDVLYERDVVIPPAGDGTTLEGLLDFFLPATSIDRQLIKALCMTLVWGGRPATRPIFVINSSSGVGAGKTALAMKVNQLLRADPHPLGSKVAGMDEEMLFKRIWEPPALQTHAVRVSAMMAMFRNTGDTIGDWRKGQRPAGATLHCRGASPK